MQETSEVYGAVMKLPRKYRTVIHLYYYEDYSTSEIARILSQRSHNPFPAASRPARLLREELKGAYDDV